jgi:hypothetical protein
MCKIENLYKIFHNENITTCWSFYGWKNIKKIVSSNKEIRTAINRNKISWSIILHSLQITFFITLGRIFDKDHRSFSIHTLINTCINNIDQFSKEQLKERKTKGWNKDDLSWIDEYIKNSYQPKIGDFLELQEEISKKNNIYEEKYKPIRHKVVAHKDLKKINNVEELFVKINTSEVEEILCFLHQIEMIIWDLYSNGRLEKIGHYRFNEEDYVIEDINILLNKIT